jgi:hypothetical protein
MGCKPARQTVRLQKAWNAMWNQIATVACGQAARTRHAEHVEQRGAVAGGWRLINFKSKKKQVVDDYCDFFLLCKHSLSYRCTKNRKAPRAAPAEASLA